MISTKVCKENAIFKIILRYQMTIVLLRSYSMLHVVNQLFSPLFNEETNTDTYSYTRLQILFSVYMATQSITFCVPHVETFAAARGAAASLFELLERDPKIDSMAKTGVSPRRVIGEIKLEDVHFSYPSRPDIKVQL